MEEVNGKIMQQGFLESYFQMARKDLNQKAKDARGEIRRLKWEIKQLEDRMKQMLRDMAETKIPREMDLQVLAEDQSSQEQLEAELKHHQGIDKFSPARFKADKTGVKGVIEGAGEQKNSAAFANKADNCLYECNAGSHVQCRLSVEPDSCIRLYPVRD